LITLNEIETKLKDVIIESPFGDGTKIIILSDELFLGTNTFFSFFENATDMSANSLLATDKGQLGYEVFIKEWQRKGYIA
jgi:hypothetical protein